MFIYFLNPLIQSTSSPILIQICIAAAATVQLMVTAGFYHDTSVNKLWPWHVSLLFLLDEEVTDQGSTMAHPPNLWILFPLHFYCLTMTSRCWVLHYIETSKPLLIITVSSRAWRVSRVIIAGFQFLLSGLRSVSQTTERKLKNDIRHHQFEGIQEGCKVPILLKCPLCG